MSEVCLSNLPEIVTVAATGLVTLASFLANVVPADSAAGRVVHWLALNFRATKK